MARFEIVFSEQANTDIQNLTDAIMYEFQAPLTAFKYVQGLLNEIKKLKTIANFLPVQKSSYFLQYGFNVKRLRYKKMTIIYTVIGNAVYIIRVVPSSTIIT